MAARDVERLRGLRGRERRHVGPAARGLSGREPGSDGERRLRPRQRSQPPPAIQLAATLRVQLDRTATPDLRRALHRHGVRRSAVRADRLQGLRWERRYQVEYLTACDI